mmetsp:Transcript_14196/g.31004  ORF Transcript_14196/g.31004 Transcript_14196/m.31004 type:complete len:156 (+) Transcript_14196:45-512(+)|eukprot:CAMPEP_0168791718 /NCGR_PEP_ID=MMETSP0725-20121227/14134_1 /TAXON_ID=265536 /ORGANISM="Amphiprora sp., Strain CCMP467" /LENGTH=155 /DNA_ID=CAMNT_0008842311 /DNA_START=49 /DNA_END=516 /DNA_ORIENTATION=+
MMLQQHAQQEGLVIGIALSDYKLQRCVSELSMDASCCSDYDESDCCSAIHESAMEALASDGAYDSSPRPPSHKKGVATRPKLFPSLSCATAEARLEGASIDLIFDDPSATRDRPPRLARRSTEGSSCCSPDQPGSISSNKYGTQPARCAFFCSCK